MIYKAFSHIGRYYKLIRQIERFLKDNPVDLVVVCDSPAFNFHVAKAAKRLGIPTVFYVAPQLWAWAGWRIHKLKKYCDKLCCILPFESDWFGSRAVEAVFVGNPLLDDLPADLAAYKKDYVQFDPQKASVAMMPGSRAAEINSLWRPMQQVALRIKEKYADARFVAVAVDQERKKVLEASQIEDFACEYTVGSVIDTASRVDFSLVASGSATLQVAAVGCPMAVLYQSSKILWHLVGRWLVRGKHLSLVNILAGRKLVPEFMPYFGSVEPIVEAVQQLLQDSGKLAKLSSDLVELVQPLRTGSASQRVAQIVGEMLG
jgi:lipid-A-disaccharide synthase